MRTQLAKIAFAVALALSPCFAQEAPERLAVYVYGAGEPGVNKSLSNKLLAAMVQSNLCTEIGDPSSFQDELAKNNKSDLASIIQVAKRYGSDYVCVVSITEVFGTHSVTARLVKIAGSQIVKTGSTDHAIKSLEDLTAISNELARQLLPTSAVVAPATPAAPPPVVAEKAFVPPAAVAPAAVAPLRHPPLAIANPPAINPNAPYAFLASGSFEQTPQPPNVAPEVVASPVPAVASGVVVDRVAAAQMAAKKQCARTYNINELLLKIKNGFPAKLKNCSSTLAKDMLNPFGKKLDPKSFMVQCPIDGIKKELPEGFPNTDKILGSLTDFVQGLINSASAGGALDPKKLVSAVGSMNVDELLSEVKKQASGPCVVNEPYEPSVESAENTEESDSDEEDKSALSFGIRAGFNLSRTHAEYSGSGSKSGDYGDIGGMQLGFLLDIPITDLFYIQPGLMYVQKGRRDDGSKTAHYIELPLLLSLKFSVFRLNAGPYFGYCLSSKSDVFDDGLDVGLSYGLGFDIGMFYIGTFYDYGLADMSKDEVEHYRFYNRTLGFNLGINL